MTRSVVAPPRLRHLKLDQSYSTASHNLITDFYVPCLSAAIRYDRAVGYFRSSLFAVVGLAMSDFARRRGSCRLICSPYLDSGDIEAIHLGLEMRKAIERRVAWELEQVLLHPANQPVVALLATLIAARAMEVRLACRHSASGIFHAKVGVFCDAADAVSFVGSANETFNAWDTRGNHETFEVFRSWGPEDTRVQRHAEYFDRLWEGREAGVETWEFPDYPKARLLEMADSAGIEHSVELVRETYASTSRGETRSPSPGSRQPRTLFPHQAEAIANWIAAGYRGIVKHATGSGKTITALDAVRRWTATQRPAIIAVPSDLLAKQWRKEAEAELCADVAFLDAGAGFGRASWQADLPDFTRDEPRYGPRVVIATMQTASTLPFLHRVQSGEHLLIVADEVHRIGSLQHRRTMEIAAGGRLGLSATPERFGDAEGTSLIFAYFGGLLQPEFGLGDAIRAGRLVPYDYHVHSIRLTSDEQAAWDEMTERIRQAYARLPEHPDGTKVLTPRFKLMLIKRAHIVKQASGKVGLARDVVRSHITPGDRWLVYCDDQHQLNSVLQALREAGLSAYEYHSAMMGARPETLAHFEMHGGVLVAIRCLDEGVDIPLVNRALVLASSSNPREFIQRRGRALRVAPGKYDAVVHDALVLPSTEFEPQDPQSAIVRTEISRALQFADNARNVSVKHELQIIARRTGLGRLKGIEIDFEDPDQEDPHG